MLRHARVFAMPRSGIILVVSGSLGPEAAIGPFTAMVGFVRFGEVKTLPVIVTPKLAILGIRANPAPATSRPGLGSRCQTGFHTEPTP